MSMRVLIATDGSSAAERAVEHRGPARELAATAGNGERARRRREPPITRAENTLSRRERRRIEMQDRRAERPQRRPRPGSAVRAPAWRSPIVLSTVGALAAGLVVVAFALLQRPAGTTPISGLAQPVSEVPAGLSAGRTLGNSVAPVTIDIWSDFQCPACRKLAVDVEPAIISTFVAPGTVKLVYHDAAFQGQRGDPRYDESVEAAAGARCAADQGRFWQMHDWLFANWNGENEGAFGAERLRSIAGAAELDLSAYDSCMAAGDKQAAVRGETQQGFTAGINSTPTLFINGQALTGVPTVSQLSELIRQAAEQARLQTVAMSAGIH